MRRRWHTYNLFAAGLLLTACAVGPDYKTPEAPSVLRYTVDPLSPQTAAGDGVSQALVIGDIPSDWWRLFANPVLDELVRDALAANPDLAAAQAALKAANFEADAQRAAFIPAFGAGIDVVRQKSSNALSPVLATPASTFNLSTPQVAVSYAPDLFGGTRRAQESADATAQAQHFALEAAYLTLVSNVALVAIADASLIDQIAAQQRIAEDAAEQSRLLADQISRGGASKAMLAAQDALTQQAQAQLILLQKQQIQEQDQLAALTGRLPAEFKPVLLSLRAFTLPHQIPLSLTADLVRQRPDVRIAEENLHAANAQVGVSIAQMLPNLTLSADTGSAATAFGNLFSPGMGFWSIGASLAQPLFDGGALLNRERAAEARLEQAKSAYRSAVDVAFQNTADALNALSYDAQVLKVDAQAADSASQSLVMARRQLALGDIARPGVILAEQTDAQAQIALIQARAARYADTVALFAALGGGWWNRGNLENEATRSGE
jgi:NodT family efflux transporter outer membrane factor (OMF) lipoprotein